MTWRRTRRGPAGDPATGPPSPAAREHLESRVTSEVGATRAAFADALLRGDQHLHHDDPRGALQALEDQRLLIDRLQARLDLTVRSAVVEREAEWVVAATDEPAIDADGSADADAATVVAAPPASSRTRRPRALATATAALVAASLAVIVGADTTSPPVPEVAALGEKPDAGTASAPDLAPSGRSDTTSTSPTPAPSDELRDLRSWSSGPPPGVEDEPASKEDSRTEAEEQDGPIQRWSTRQEEPPATADPDGTRSGDEDPDGDEEDADGDEREDVAEHRPHEPDDSDDPDDGASEPDHGGDPEAGQPEGDDDADGPDDGEGPLVDEELDLEVPGEVDDEVDGEVDDEVGDLLQE